MADNKQFGNPKILQFGDKTAGNRAGVQRQHTALVAKNYKDRSEQIRANVQRPLWASTSTKDPAFPDTMYVVELVAPDGGQHLQWWPRHPGSTLEE